MLTPKGINIYYILFVFAVKIFHFAVPFYCKFIKKYNLTIKKHELLHMQDLFKDILLMISFKIQRGLLNDKFIN